MNDNRKKNQMLSSINYNELKNSKKSEEFEQEKYSLRDSHTGNNYNSYTFTKQMT